tara:strand:+ start:1437 stop:2054 length:618 start_codon:yes stop_codon:yes gene_type:complete
MFESLLIELDKNLGSAERMLSRVPAHACTTAIQSMCVQSYIFLTHAAFEYFIEEVAQEAVNYATKRCKDDQIITKSLLCLVTSNIVNAPADISRAALNEQVTRNLLDSAADYKRAFNLIKRKNNGIKAENQKNLLIPAGIDPEVVDLTTFNALNTYGDKRGDIAHTFLAIRTEYTKSSVLTDTNIIRLGLDLYVAELRRSAADRF